MSSTTPTSAKSLLPLDVLFDNPVFAGGIGLAGLGAAAALGRKGIVSGAGLLKRRLLVDIEISKHDESYPWLMAWLSLPRSNQGFIASKITRIHHLALKTKSTSTATGSIPRKFSGQTGYGKHIIRHKNAYLQVSRDKDHKNFNMNTGEPHETLTLTTLYAHRHIFEDIFREVHVLAASEKEGKTVILGSRGTEWSAVGQPKLKRPLESVILDDGIKDRVVADVKDFLGRKQWYVDRGIPYRRGYLLYGPPGSGKSSFIQALAGELDFGLASINLSERGMTDDKLLHLLTKLPPQTLLLLEDADAAFQNRRQVGEDGYSGPTVTFSGLLNALDGVTAGEERIGFLTTNHIDRLDEALIRPGRVDMTVRIGEATRYQAAQMWERFYGDIDEHGHGKKRFLERLTRLELVTAEGENNQRSNLHTSTAAIQGLFLFNKDDMDGAIDAAEGLIPRIYEPERVEDRAGIKVRA